MPHLVLQSFVGKGIGRELIAEEAADDFLSENDRVECHGGALGGNAGLEPAVTQRTSTCLPALG
ncbi:MAG: hypothetical protein ACKPJD_08190, partial [Planctomycetaceae bacterium]